MIGNILHRQDLKKLKATATATIYIMNSLSALEVYEAGLYFFLNSSQPDHDTAIKKKGGYLEIVNGSSILPELMFEKLTAYRNFRYFGKTSVTGLDQTIQEVSLLCFLSVE